LITQNLSAISIEPVRWVLASFSLSMVLSSLGTSIANGLPAVVQTFFVYVQEAQWIVLAYFFSITTLIISCPPAFAQPLQRPDSGTLQESQRQIPLLPQPGALSIRLPQAEFMLSKSLTATITPAAFRFEGNTVFSSKTLSAQLSQSVDVPTDLAGLGGAVSLINKYYRSRGYLLTEVYLPEQAFKAAGGTVTIAVIEARIGSVHVRVEGDKGSAEYARALVASLLKPGALITEQMLDKPVLLLRDLAGMDASSMVEPGEQMGQVNVTMTLHPKGVQVRGAIGSDNFGSSATGALRLSNTLNLINLVDRGDVLSLQAQVSEGSLSHLYRLAYSVPVVPDGTRLSISAARAEYTLGKQFAALGASGEADVLGLSLIRPLLRTRESNLYGLFSMEHKTFRDYIATPTSDSERQIVSARFGLLGNFVDNAAGAGGSSSYALSVLLGRAELDAISLELDQGPGGPRTAGVFHKLNLELQRVQFFGTSSSVHVNVQAQSASKNLASGEKMALGGPTGVRGYPIGEGIGDSGLLLNLEYRYQLPALVALADELISLTAFYDYGTVRLNQDGEIFAGAPNRIALDAIGMGILAGRSNHFLITAHLAWPVTSATLSTGNLDRSPRAWMSVQKWF
jgi:hemolysin activation/secretion protein